MGGRRFRLGLVLVLTAALAVYGLSVNSSPAQAVATDITYVHDELGRLVAVVAPGQGTARYAYDAVGNLTSISRQSASIVAILEFTPNSGAPGTPVTIYGSGFSATPSQNTVQFNGITATVTSSTTTQIVTAVPATATTGPISVTSPTGTATSATSFSVIPNPAPTLSSFTPTIGASGTPITIAGSNFDVGLGNNVVSLNTTRVALTSASATSLAGHVPPATGSGKIVVRTPAGKVTSSSDFIVPPPGFAAADIENTDRMAIGETKSIAVSTPGKVSMMLFDGARNQRISVKVSHNFPSCTGLSIYNPDTTTLRSDCESASDFVDVKTLALSGTYAMLVDPTTTGTGTMTFTLYDVPADVTGTITAGGAPASLTITVPGQDGHLTFAGTAGQRISLKVTADTIPFCNSVYITAPDGSNVGNGCMSEGSFIDTKTLTQTGTHTITLDPYDRTGSMTFQLYEVPPDVTGTITPGGAPASLTTTVPGQNGHLTFAGTAGQRISLKVTADTIPFCNDVFIKAPDGSNVGNGCMSEGSFIDTKTLTQTGTHTITLDPGGDRTGSMSFELYDVPADSTGTMTIGGSPETVTVTVPGQNATRTFSGTAGQVVTLTQTGSTMCTYIAIKKPDNTTLVQSGPCSATSIGPATLPTTGTYTIVIDPSGAATGSTTLSLTSSGGGGGAAAMSSSIDPFGLETPKGELAEESITQAAPTEISVDGDWVPQVAHRRDGWRALRPKSLWESVPALQAPSGETALAGRVLTLEGQPLEGVALEIANGPNGVTDDSGRFLLRNAPSGYKELFIDGGAASAAGKRYGVFEYRAKITAGVTNVLPLTIWMPRVDEAHAAEITSPLPAEKIITTPHIPGLEVRLPAGASVTDEDGNPVSELSITAIPLDRTPFPLPPDVATPIYFTVQPANAYVSGGAQLIYPNYFKQPPGSRVDFWHYNPGYRGWYVYGGGTVTADGSQVVPDPGVRVYEFTGAMTNTPGKVPPGTEPGEGRDGDPVALGSGMFVLEHTDIALPDLLPLELTRTYRPDDSTVRPFGRGATHSYDLYLWRQLPDANFTNANVILPDGTRVHYVRISAGNNFDNAEFEQQDRPGPFYKTRIKWNGNGWDLTLRDGTVYVFGNEAPLQAIRDRYGNKITIVRDAGTLGKITAVRSPTGRWIELSYDASERITQLKDNTGRTVAYTYDGANRLETVTNALSKTTTYTWDSCPTSTAASCNRLISIEDPRGITYLTNRYDINGRVDLQTMADGSSYEYAYVVSGGKVTQTDVTLVQSPPPLPATPRRTTRRVSFNADGYITSDIRALGTTEQQELVYTRDATTHLVTRVTDKPLNRKTDFAYYANGELQTVTRMATTTGALTTSYEYEPVFNQISKVTDPLNHATIYDYFPDGSLETITNPEGNVWKFFSSPEGQLARTRDPFDKETTLTYDLGDLVSTTDPLNRTATQFVDAAGRLVRATSPLGATTSYVYDAANQVTRITDALGGNTDFTYDENGNLKTLKDARLKTTTFAYNNMDQLLTRTDQVAKAETFVYDEMGNLTKHTDRRGRITEYRYGGLGRRTFAGFGTTYDILGNPSYANSITYTWDGGSRMTKADDSVGGADVTLTWDNFDRLTSETTSQGKVSSTYYKDDRRKTMTVQGQPVVTYTYDDAGRLTKISRADSPATEVLITPDAAGRTDDVTLPNGIKADYSYDDASQLTAITWTKGVTPVGDLGYAYDPSGRRSAISGSFARTSLPAAVSTFTHNNANRMTKKGSTTYTYDLSGNLTGDGTNTNVWNARGQLSQITKLNALGLTEVVASFAYDALGRRRSKTLGDGVLAQTTTYLNDADNPVQELVGGTPTANMLNGLQMDEFLARTETAGTTSYLSDALQSTLGLTDSAGSITTSYTYEPFGATTSAGAAAANPYRFTGREEDGTGLYYYRARYFSPSMQRFISEDPLGFEGGDANLYAYASNSPVGFTDPSGKLPVILLFAAGGALLGAGTHAVHMKLTGRKVTFGGLARSAGVGAGIAAAGYWLGSGVLTRLAPAATLATPTVSNPKLQNIISDLYRGTTNPLRIGTGTTMDAVRYELQTGERVFGKLHIQKAEDAIRGIEKLLNNVTLTFYDRIVAQSILDDLYDAFRGSR